jgi:quinoprotein glucose dehydrogenase
MGWSFVNDICRSERRPTLTGARNSGKKKRSSSVLCASYFYEKNKAALEFQRWPGALNVPDPVAVTVDPQGRVYVSATTRRKVADQDIREHRDWIPDDVALTSVEEKEAFLKRELAPGKVRLPGGGLLDNNKDGSIDWKDLTIHSERIYQLRDTAHDGTADKITIFAEGFNSVVTGIAAGILYHDGWVYVTIAPDLVRLLDTNDDGVADEREIVAHGFGMHIAYAGHDMHGPRIGRIGASTGASVTKA